MKTLVRNNSSGPLAVAPFRQILAPGGWLICNETPAEVRAAFVGLDASELEVGEVDASGITAQLTISPLKSALALDGSVNPASLILVPAGHQPGMYLVYRSIRRETAPAAGSIMTQINWKDAGRSSIAPNTTTLVGGTSNIINPGVIPCFSDGSAAISCDISFTGMTGACNVDVRAWAVLQQ